MLVCGGAVTPLWPAGHLPLKGGDQAVGRFLPIAQVDKKAAGPCHSISPLEGEMPGKAEGGIAAARFQSL